MIESQAHVIFYSRSFSLSLSLLASLRASEYSMFVFLPQCSTDAAITFIMHDIDDLNNIPIVNHFCLICFSTLKTVLSMSDFCVHCLMDHFLEITMTYIFNFSL